MNEQTDWSDLPEASFTAFQQRLELVETLLDETLSEEERQRIREAYRQEQGVTERTKTLMVGSAVVHG